MYWALYFFIWGIRDIIDAKPLFRNSDIDNLSADVRKKYRHRRGIAFLLCSVVAAYIFVYESIYGMRMNFKLAFIYFGIPYAVPIIYIICLKKKYDVPWFWTKKQTEEKKD
ncbi:MAG: hypothetical protein K2N87_03330 [Eubacterium sp.]|nr:hypothetical protein [Eubacterium sp.]